MGGGLSFFFILTFQLQAQMFWAESIAKKTGHMTDCALPPSTESIVEKKLDIWLVVPYLHLLFSAASTDVVSRKYYEIFDIRPAVSSLQSSDPSLLPPPPLLRVLWRTGRLSLPQQRCRSTLQRHSAWQANSVSQHGNGQLALGRARLAAHFSHPLISPCRTAKQTTLRPDYQVLHAAWSPTSCRHASFSQTS